MPRPESDLSWKLSPNETGIDEPVRMPGDQDAATGLGNVLPSRDLDTSKEDPGEKAIEGDDQTVGKRSAVRRPFIQSLPSKNRALERPFETMDRASLVVGQFNPLSLPLPESVSVCV